MLYEGKILYCEINAISLDYDRLNFTLISLFRMSHLHHLDQILKVLGMFCV